VSSAAEVTESDDVDFVRVCRVDELPPFGAAAADVYGQIMAIVKTREGEIYAVDDTCSHANVSLSEGELEGHTLECWLHGSRFDVRTGDPSGPPATVPINVYPVKVENDEVFVGTTPLNN
jgi:3-phenylpropionate/trans-cinnamate dioxygenase ferredoxin subunit